MKSTLTSNFSCGIAVMAKASHPGRTKTRLSPPLTLEEAADLNTAFLKDIAANLKAAANLAPIQGYMAFSPPGSEPFFDAHLSPDIRRFEVTYPDFGLCLRRALEVQFEAGHEAACVLNSDSPTLPVAFLIETAYVLAQPGERIVLGPASDGGYYILGCKRVYAPLFEGIAWSTEAVAAQTLTRAEDLGLDVHVLPKWYDVDDREALLWLLDETLDATPFAQGFIASRASHSRALLADMRENADLDLRLKVPAINAALFSNAAAGTYR